MLSFFSTNTVYPISNAKAKAVVITYTTVLLIDALSTVFTLAAETLSDDDINSALIRCIKSKRMSMANFCKISGIAESTMVRYNKKSAKLCVLGTILLTFFALYVINIIYNI